MADEQLKIKIGADVGQAVTGINQVSTSLKKLVPGSNQATFALTNLGRVAQDAPFGLIGIANNIEPLIASFVSLRKETGSASGAFKALGSSLMGGGGLILLVGLASTAMTLFGQASQGAAKSARDLADVKENLAKISEEVAKSTAGELANLQSLISIAGDANLSNEARLEGMKELNRLYPEHIDNTKIDANTSNVLANVYDKVSAAILNQAKARSIANAIDESASRQRKLETQNLAENLDFMEKASAALRGAFGGIGSQTQFALETAQKNRAKGIEGEIKLQQTLVAQLQSVNTELAKSGDLFKDRDVKPLKVKELKVKPEKLLISSQDIKLDTIDVPTNRFSPAEMLGKIRQPFGNLVLVYNEAAEAAKKLQARNEEIAGFVTSNLTPAFTNFFEDLLSGSKTTFADFGKAILGVIKKLIAAAAAAAVLALIISAVSGGAGAAAGGMSFLQAFKGLGGGVGIDFSKFSAVKGAGSGALMGAANNSFRPQIVGVVQGQNIALVLQRFNADRGRNG